MDKYAQQKSHAQILCKRDGEHAMLTIPSVPCTHEPSLAHMCTRTRTINENQAHHTHTHPLDNTHAHTHKHENKGMSTHTIRICTHSLIVGAHYTQDHNG